MYILSCLSRLQILTHLQHLFACGTINNDLMICKWIKSLKISVNVIKYSGWKRTWIPSSEKEAKSRAWKRRRQAWFFVKTPSCLWPAATKSHLVLCTETLISDGVVLNYGGQGLEVGLHSLFLAVLLSLQKMTLENHSLFVLLCPYGDESFLSPSSLSVCF